MLRRASIRQSLAQFFRQMAVLCDSGIALERGLEICARQTSNLMLRSKVLRLSEDVRHGVRLSDGMTALGAPFSPLHGGVILAAESTGGYDGAFEQLAVWEEKADRIERQVGSLMSYPLLVSAIAFVGTFILLRFLAPLIESVMEQVGGQPALPTRIVLMLGHATADPLCLSLAGLAIVLVLWSVPHLSRSRALRSGWEQWSLGIPLVGNLLWKAWVVRVARCLDSLLSAGIPLVRCIELTADATGNGFLGRHVLLHAAYGVRKGESLSQALPTEMMSRAFMGMLAVGETSGTMPEMLRRVADLHEVELTAEIEALFRATEPIIMGAVGIVVLVCLVCAFQPVYELVMKL